MSKKHTKQAADQQPEATPTPTEDSTALPVENRTTPTEDATALPVENRMVSTGMLRVRVGRQPLNEDGFRAPGDIFEVSEIRRRALGTLVEDVQENAQS
jgi:hypothetical protein